MEPEQLLDTAAAAHYLTVKPASLRRWTSTRKITFVRVGSRAVRFRRRDLDRFIAAGERPALRPVAGAGGDR